MSEIKSYKDLLIWKKGITIVKLVYELVKAFPQEEIYTLSSQLKRASVSIPSNIAEGYGRNTDKSFSHFLDIAKELGIITNEKIYQELLNQIEEESKMINAFSKKLKS